jgi:exosome complex component RRP42
MNDTLKANISKWFEKGMRYDGRGFEEFRPVSIEYDVTKNAEGSARVKLGNTEVIAGVKLSVGTPYPDTLDAGNLMVGAELLPLSNPGFESGPPGEEATEIARVVDRGIRESKAIDTKKLCIKKGEKVWIVSVDVCTINSDGNLIDASALATIAALKVAKFPEFDGETVDYKKLTDKKMPLTKVPISITIVKAGGHLFVDPNEEEEDVSEARLTVAITEDGKLCAMQKGGEAPLSLEEIGTMVDLAHKKAKELIKELK